MTPDYCFISEYGNEIITFAEARQLLNKTADIARQESKKRSLAFKRHVGQAMLDVYENLVRAEDFSETFSYVLPAGRVSAISVASLMEVIYLQSAEIFSTHSDHNNGRVDVEAANIGSAERLGALQALDLYVSEAYAFLAEDTFAQRN